MKNGWKSHRPWRSGTEVTDSDTVRHSAAYPSLRAQSTCDRSTPTETQTPVRRAGDRGARSETRRRPRARVPDPMLCISPPPMRITPVGSSLSPPSRSPPGTGTREVPFPAGNDATHLARAGARRTARVYYALRADTARGAPPHARDPKRSGLASFTRAA